MSIVISDEDRLKIKPYAPRISAQEIPTPGIFDTPCACIRINNDWLPHLVGIMAVLEQPDAWIGTDTEIFEAIQQVLELENCMGTCGCDTSGAAERTAAMAYRLQLQTIFGVDGLDGIAPDRPDITFDTDSGDAGDEITQRDNALCNACVDYVTTIARSVESDAEAIGLATASGTGLLLFAAFPIVGVLFIGATVLITAALLLVIRNTNTRNEVACCMRQGLIGQTITEANFASALDSCGYGALSDEELLRVIVADSLDDQGNYLSFVASLGAFMGKADADTVCPCDETWSHQFLDGEGLQDLVLASRGAPFGLSTYDAGNDRVDGDCVVNDGVAVAVTITFPATTITRVIVSVAFFGNRATAVDDTRIGVAGNFGKFVDQAHGLGPGTDVADTGVISSLETDLYIDGFVGVFACGSHYSRITKIIVEGIGDDPFL